MGWILINTEQDGQAVDVVEKDSEKFEVYETLVWVEDKNNKITRQNLQYYKWTGKQFEGEEPKEEEDDVAEPMTDDTKE
jgi:hypothetical protein